MSFSQADDGPQAAETLSPLLKAVHHPLPGQHYSPVFQSPHSFFENSATHLQTVSRKVLKAHLTLWQGSNAICFSGYCSEPSHENTSYFDGLSLNTEFVFNTALTGYEEVITDPSYHEQSIVFTTPHLGTTGWTNLESESAKTTPTAVICRQLSHVCGNQASQLSLQEKLDESQVPLIWGIDTRALTLVLRTHGALPGTISLASFEAPNSPLPPPAFQPQPISPRAAFPKGSSFFVKNTVATAKIVVVDFGCKRSIVQQILKRNCEVHTIPWNSVTQDRVKNLKPHALLFSNGPGNPMVLADQAQLLEEYKSLALQYPTFGICFGHQILAMSFGATTQKIGFGHHAINHPVAAIDHSGAVEKVAITSQNHNYAVEEASLPDCFEVSHRHLNDHSIAGLRHRHRPLHTVQFHPEAGPGPRDSRSFFDDLCTRAQEAAQ